MRHGRCQRSPRIAPRRHFTTRASTRQTAALAVSEEITRAEYTDLVNTYDLRVSHAPAPPTEHKQPQHYPLAPRLVIPPEKEDKPPFAPRVVLPPEDEGHARDLKRFRQLLIRPLGQISLNKLWDAYQRLHAPRLRYLHDLDIRRLFKHLSWVEFKHEQDAMPRYNAVLDECLGEHIPVTSNEWNTAVAFAGRWSRHVTTAEVRRAVETWMRMESHNTQATPVTFNILFDVAVKASRFALADTLYNELKARDMPLNRYFRNSMIYYAGLRGDGDAVRQAFRDLVNAGEIVDTSVMNCVILSLVRAGEPTAAEHVYAKMKRLHSEKSAGTSTPRSWQKQKELGALLNKAAQRLREERAEHESSFYGSGVSTDDRREEVQKRTPIAPNARTYRILIQHHAYTSGRLDQIQALMAEMKGEEWNVHGSVYVHVLRGFWRHGGRVALWDRDALEGVWRDFLAASEADPESHDDPDDNGSEGSELERAPYFTKSLAVAAVRAFHKCAGKKRMLEVWEEIRERWGDMDGDERDWVQGTIDKLVREDAMYISS